MQGKHQRSFRHRPNARSRSRSGQPCKISIANSHVCNGSFPAQDSTGSEMTNGRSCWIRTNDLFAPNEARYQTTLMTDKWMQGRRLNPLLQRMRMASYRILYPAKVNVQHYLIGLLHVIAPCLLPTIRLELDGGNGWYLASLSSVSNLR